MNEKTTRPKRHVLAAWLVCGVIYMWGAMEVVAEAGFIAIPFQFIMGAVFSLFIVGIATLVGFLLRLPVVSRAWYSTVIPSATVLAAALIIILFGQSFGITITLTSTETNDTYQTLHPTAAYGSMFAAVFATLHFPISHGAPLHHERSV